MLDSLILPVVSVTAHVCQFTLVTVLVGVRSSVQLLSTEYGSICSTYVWLSSATIPKSHATACVRVVRSCLVCTVNVCISTTGTTLLSSLPVLSRIGTSQAPVPTSLLAAVPNTGLCSKSAYSHEKATADSSFLS